MRGESLKTEFKLRQIIVTSNYFNGINRIKWKWFEIDVENYQVKKV